MDFNHERDQQRLAQLPYGTKRKQVQLKRLYEFLLNPDYDGFQKKLFVVKEWLISPRRLATTEFTGLCRHVCTLLEKKQPLDPALELLLELIDDVPSQECQAVICAHEHNLLVGYYDAIVRDT